MYFWHVKKISENEYHVIETSLEGESEYILAKCSGPVPANDIVHSMKISQTLRLNKDNIHNSIVGIESALQIFNSSMVD